MEKVGDIGNKVLRDRQALSEDGIVIVIITLSSKNNSIVGRPDVISRGFIYVKDNASMIDEAKQIIEKSVKDSIGKGKIDFTHIKLKVKSGLKSFFFAKVARRPILLIRIVEI